MAANRPRSESKHLVTAGTTEDSLDRLVADLRLVYRMAAIDAALQVGKLVMDRIFDGDGELWRSHGAKDVSLRKLAARPDLPMSPAVLYRSVAMYDLSLRFGGLRKLKHLGPSHLRAVLGLESGRQVALLRRADDERWTVERLQDEVKRLRSGDGDRRGRRPLPELVKTVGHLTRIVELRAGVLEEASYLEGLDDDTVAVLAQRVDAMRARIESLHQALEERRRASRAAAPRASHSSAALPGAGDAKDEHGLRAKL